MFSYNGTRVSPCYPVRLSWLTNSLVVFGGRKPLMRYLSPGEDSHKGYKAIHRWFSVSDCLPLPRILLQERFGAHAHLPRISSHLCPTPAMAASRLWAHTCGHKHPLWHRLRESTPDWMMAQALPCALETGLDTSCSIVFFLQVPKLPCSLQSKIHTSHAGGCPGILMMQGLKMLLV